MLPRIAALAVLLLQAAPSPSPWTDVAVPAAPAGLARLAEEGERLYGWHCLPCHGPEGKGDGPSAQRLGLRPRDFTRGLFKLKSSGAGEPPFDDDLFRTITVGLPVSFMPPFREALAPDDRWAVVAFVKTLARPGESKARTRIEAPRRPADAARGGPLFRKSCVPCHGPQGKGDGPSAAELQDGAGRPARVPDLARGEVEFLAGARAEDVYRVLTTGLEGSAMPAFAPMPEQDRWDVAAFVTTLYRPVAAGERLFYAKGCVSCHTIGKGRHLGPDLKGVGARRTSDWLARWLRSPQLMASTDPAAKALLDEYKVVMPEPGLGDVEVESLAGFLSGLRGP
jgi:mono/diheme cytochrome c family protein